MSYKVLYRKYRPSTFNDIVDQKFIIDTLKESIIINKISHAYIFSGPKGTGKTSTAKVFAKAINCENPIDGEPCGKCDSCTNFDINPDIIELDAASNNKVEDIREIINNVKLAPTRSKFKIYIIDEVHMLTNSASNAFLLTLEEPPAHAIFILATTNPESLPSTIMSRCQHFAFSKISKKALIDRLKFVLKNENINVSEDVINEIAELSEGGLRDALSILDQIITLNKPIDYELLSEQFGVVSEKIIKELINSIICNNYTNIRNIFLKLKEHGINEKSFINKFVHLLTSKICDLKFNSNEYEVQRLKKILEEIYNTESFKSSFNYYDVIEMIIITNLDNSNISQEIIDENKKEISESADIENTYITTKLDVDKKEIVGEDKNLHEVNNNLIDIRINNSFVAADIKLKKQFEENYEKFVEKLKKDPELYSLLLDAKVGVVSPTNVLLITETPASSNLLNKYADKISLKVKSEKKYVFVDQETWKILTKEYKNNIKSNVEYTLIDEPVSEIDNEIENIANDIFGINNIVVEDE